jgi:deoxyribose-phosphate aldolase
VRPSLPGLIDHTLLKPEATRADISRLCDEALEHDFGAVCVAGSWVEICVQRLQGSDVAVVYWTEIGITLQLISLQSSRLRIVAS